MEELNTTHRGEGLRRYGFIVASYLLATLFTGAFYIGDTPGYVSSILAYQNGKPFDWDNPFWEFGHLLWRPLGFVTYKLTNPLTAAIIGEGERANLTLALISLSWIAGLLSLLLMDALVRRVCGRVWVARMVTIAFLCSNTFLNYLQTGSPYVPGLMFLLLGFYLLARTGDAETAEYSTSLGAGAALAASVCLWFPYVLAVPAALAFPLLLHGWERRRLRIVLETAVALSLFVALAYGAVMYGLGIRDTAGLKHWITSASHGQNQVRGVARALFGFPRSFVNMGNDGQLFKRFLIHDPYNPVSLFDIVRLSLWKVVLFYLFLAAMSWNLLRTSPGRRLLALLVISSVPVFVFAIFIFEAGGIERYLPFYPALFLALAGALCAERSAKVARGILLAYVTVMIVSNVVATARPTLNEKQERVAARIRDLQPRLKPTSLVAVVHLQDELIGFNNNFPFNPVNRRGDLQVYNVLEVGAARILTWREDFAAKALKSWDAGGDVWVSKRLLSERPRAEWNWVEGDDRRVAWADLPAFFSQLEMGESVGGDDGFVLLQPTQRNRDYLVAMNDQLKA